MIMFQERIRVGRKQSKYECDKRVNDIEVPTDDKCKTSTDYDGDGQVELLLVSKGVNEEDIRNYIKCCEWCSTI